MQPKLRSDTLYVPSPDGTYLMNNQKALTLPGSQTYRWIERLAPHLDGRTTLDELTTGLPADKRGAVTNLVQFLLDQGFATDVAGDRPHQLTVPEEQTYAAEIAFVGYFRDSAGSRFEQFRNTRGVAIGSGRTLAALVQANLHCGIADLQVMAVDDAPENLAVHERHAQAARKRDARQTLTYAKLPDWNRIESVRAALREFDVVMHVADRPFLARARLVNQVCVEEGKTLVQAIVLGDHAWIGPLVAPDHPRSCWECAWRRAWPRLSGALLDFTDRPDVEPTVFLTGPPAALVSNHVAFEVFKSVTGAGPLDTSGGVVRIDLETLRTHSHRFVPHPMCSVSHGSVATPRTAGPATADDESFSTAAAILFDDMLGVFTEISERDFVQLPLKVSEVVFPDPSIPSGGRVAAHGAGTTVRAARLQATRRACELYAVRLVDRGKLVTTAAAEHRARLVGAEAEQDQFGWVWARDLVTDRRRLVPAAAAFPVLRRQRACTGTAPGLASGYSWAEAVCRGVSGQATWLSVAEFGGDGDPVPRVDVGATDDVDTDRYLRMLAATGQQFDVYDVTGCLRAPAFAFCAGERTVAWVSDLDVSTAIASGLERILLDSQARSNGQLDYCPDAPALPPPRRGDRTVLPSTVPAGGWEDQVHRWCDLFTNRNISPVAVPLDHDLAVTAVLPHVVNVLLVSRA